MERFLLLFGLVVTLVFSGFYASAFAEAATQYVNKTYDFSLALPSSWAGKYKVEEVELFQDVEKTYEFSYQFGEGFTPIFVINVLNNWDPNQYEDWHFITSKNGLTFVYVLPNQVDLNMVEPEELEIYELADKMSQETTASIMKSFRFIKTAGENSQGVNQSPILVRWSNTASGFNINKVIDLNGDKENDMLKMTGGKKTDLTIHIIESSGKEHEIIYTPNVVEIMELMLSDLNGDGKIEVVEIAKLKTGPDYYLSINGYENGEFTSIAGSVPITKNFKIQGKKIISGDSIYIFDGKTVKDQKGKVTGVVEKVEPPSKTSPSNSKPSSSQLSGTKATFKGKTVTAGMTKAQVYNLLGKPTEIRGGFTGTPQQKAQYIQMVGQEFFDSINIENWNYIRTNGYELQEAVVVLFQKDRVWQVYKME